LGGEALLRLRCASCGLVYGVEDALKSGWLCPRCGGLPRSEFSGFWDPAGEGLIRYSSALPVTPTATLGEGGTPLVVREFFGVRAYLKLEYLNPSGSFKDRGTSLTVALAKALGVRRLVEDTSGNTGISVATYSAAGGLECVITLPRTAPKGKKDLLRALGAEVVEAGSRGEAAALAPRLARERGGMHVRHTVNPLYIDGARTVAYEAFEQGFRGAHVVVPVGSGGLILGIYEGFRDLLRWGLIEELPAVHAVEDASLTRIAVRRRVGWGRGGGGAADALLVPNPPRAGEVVEAVDSTGGSSVAVTSAEVAEAVRTLVKSGFIVEPTSAAALAGLKLLVEEGVVGRGDEVLVPLTGSGLKVIDELLSLTRFESG